jgi:amino acid transporter
VLGIVLVFKAGHHNTLGVFGIHYANVPGFHGWSGVMAGSIFTLLAFSGFEAAAPMAEETKDARRNVPRAIMIATVCIGILYTFTTYAADVAYGPSKFGGFAASANGVPWDGLANSVSVVFWFLVLVAIVNSTIANAIAGSNVFTRTSYAFGRAGVFPKSLAKLNDKFKSPQNAIVVQLLLGLAIALGLGAWKGATTAFGIVATGLTVGVVIVYLVTNISCFAYFTRHRREERHPVLHILFPIIAVVFMAPAVINATGITGVPGLKWVSPLPAPLSYGAWAIGVWIVVGLISLVVLRQNKREAINAVATLHV